MKKTLLSMLVLSAMIVGANTAQASRARVNVMGQGDNGFILNGSGSLYYDDMYNIFYNPSYVNDFKNWAIIEKGATNNGGVTPAAQDPHAEGGFVTSFMNFNLGVFMNRTDAFSLGRIPTLTGTPVASTGVRPLDVTLGGDTGVKWGVGFTEATQSGDPTSGTNRDKFWAIRAGLQVADFAPFASYRLTGRSTDTNTGVETRTKDSLIGTKYTYGDWTPYVAYRWVSQHTGPSTTDLSGRNWIAGVGRNTKIGETARLVYNINYSQSINRGTQERHGRRTILPIDLALEGDLASWITVRGGIQYRLIDRVSGNGLTPAGTQGDSTIARIGATFHINKIDVDWAYGQNANNGAGNLDADSVGFDSGTFSNISVAYRW